MSFELWGQANFFDLSTRVDTRVFLGSTMITYW